MLELIRATGGLVEITIAVVAAIALLAFFWGLVKFVFRFKGDEKEVEEGKRIMKWGLIALFVMVSVWGIVRFMQSALLPGGVFTPSGGSSSPWGDYL